MEAKITGTGDTVKGKTLKEIKRKMGAMLKVEGPRALTAVTDTGAKVHVEMYEGQDYIKTAGGAYIR
jgi:hypothetical protein